MHRGYSYYEKIPKQCCSWILHGECGRCISNVPIDVSYVSSLSVDMCMLLYSVESFFTDPFYIEMELTHLPPINLAWNSEQIDGLQ